MHSESAVEWFKLDNAATMYPSVASRRTTTLFRVAATLDAPVKVAVLQRALETVAPRFPYYLVEVRAGLFWYYLARRDHRPSVEADHRYPCMEAPRKGGGHYLFHVRAYRRRVAVEFSHIITDGSGAIAFLRSLLLQYFSLIGLDCGEVPDVMTAGSPIDPGEYEDAYRRFYDPHIPGPGREGRSFQIPDPLLPVGVYRITTGIIPLDPLKAAAKEHGVTVTVFLAAVLLDSLQSLYRELPRHRRGRNRLIRVEIPVNLRRLYPTRSMRNFSLYVTPGIDTRLGNYSLEEIIREVHHFMQITINERSINRQIARNIRGETHPLVRIIPLALKNLVLRRLYFTLGESLFTTCLTNLGPAEMPEPAASHIERFEMISPPSVTNKTNCGIMSYRDRVYVTFGRVIEQAEVERRFFISLVKMGIPVRIEVN